MSFLRFLRAAWVSICAQPTKKSKIAAIRSFVAALRSGLVPRKTAERRLAGCSNCPVYDAERQTCGDGAFVMIDGERLQNGCGCYLPMKVWFRKAQCWLWERSGATRGVDWDNS